jgi:hypothetical protein
VARIFSLGDTDSLVGSGKGGHDERETMKTSRLLLAPIVAALALSGCLQNETTIRVKADGSGTIVEETLLGAQMMAMLSGFGNLGGEEDKDKPAKDPLDEMFGEDKAKEKAAKMGGGVTLDKIEKINKDGKKGARVIYKFADINKVTINPDEATSGMNNEGPAAGGDAGGGDAKKKVAPIRFQLAGGKLTIKMPKPDAGKKDKPDAGKEEGEKPEEADAAAKAQQEAMMKTMLADMKIAIRVVAEPGIAETDATYHDGDSITLMEMNFAEIIANADAMKKLEQLEGKSPDEVAAALKDIKGVKAETKETVTIKMK